MGGFSNRPGGGGNFGGSGRGGTNVKFPQLDREVITSFIGQFSSEIRYWKAVACPCKKPDTGQPNVSCHQCRGLGWFHLDYEKDTIYQRAQVHQRTSSKLTDAGGMVAQGYSSITLQPGVIPGEGDLVQVCKDREVVNDEYHVLGSKLTDGTTAERFRFRDIVCVELVALYNALTKSIEILPKSAWEFIPEERKIRFTSERVEGTQYSVRYLAVPEYVVRAETAKPLLRVTHDDNLPEPYRYTKDIVYPFNVKAVRLDRAILQRQRGAVDTSGKTGTESTFNNHGRGWGGFRG